MLVNRFIRAGIGVLTTLWLISQATGTLAGTTGTINGTVSNADGTPVVDAQVIALSPSATQRGVTDAHGHYILLSVLPDTYTVTASKDGYDTVQQNGITVIADQTQTVNFVTKKSVATLGKVTVVGTATALVSRSQTSNIYAVNSQQMTTVQSAGGGNNLANAYSAIDTVPGIYHFSSNAGWGQTLYIHGGSYTEVGYEYDGVPVNRAFDQYNGDTLSTLGNQQVQVYTGGAPASSSTSTVSGFINQVIRTGTYPGFANLNLAMGSPSLWNGAKFEIGGAVPDQRFTYYAGVSGYSQTLRYYDQFNGGNSVSSPFENISAYNSALFTFYGEGTLPYCNVSSSGVIIDPTPKTLPDAGCYIRGIPQNINTNVGAGDTPAQVVDHEGVINLHYELRHQNGTQDDIQGLYSGSFLYQRYYSSIADDGGLTNVTTATGGTGFLAPSVPANLIPLITPCSTTAPCFTDGYAFPNGTQFGQSVTPAGGSSNNGSSLPYIRYLYPSSPTNRAYNSTIPIDQRDGESVGDEIEKLQYTHAMGSNAYLRFFGYSLFSDWLQNAPNANIYAYEIGLEQLAPAIASPDYELSSHTYGGELQFQDQVNDKNLLNFTVNYVTAHTLRYNNSEMRNTAGTAATVLSDSAGNCYDAATGAKTFCYDPTATGTFGDPTQGGTPITGAAAAAGAGWHVSFLGPNGTYNTVTPTFATGGLQDQFHPSDRWLLNAGLRYENYNYQLANSDTPDNNFWFKAAAQTFCYDPATGQPVTQPLGATQPPPAPPFEGLTCPNSPITGQPTVHPDGLNGHLLFTNLISGNINHSEWLPRFGGTYTINQDSVVRFNYGRYAQPVETAFTEYLYAPGAGRSAASFNFVNFWGFGFTNPRHDLPPVTANNYDFSYEQNLPKESMSFRVTPFFRASHGEFGTISIGPNFASGYPYANEQAQGVEFQINGGNPNANGFSGQFSATYTHATVKLLDNPQGKNAADTLNAQIDGFNALTAGGNVQGQKGAPCYLNTPTSTAPDPGDCVISGNNITLKAGAPGNVIINPYYFDAPQADLDRNGSFPPYLSFPSGVLSSGNDIVWPWLFSGYASYKHNRITITPVVSLLSGNGYGGPTDLIGYDPRTCQSNQGAAGITTGNPGKALFQSCGASLVSGGNLSIPNPATGRYDGLSQYLEPWLLNLNAQISAELSPRTTARIVFANLINTCFGGSSTPWSKAFAPGNQTCVYLPNGWAVSNFWNGTGPNDSASNAAPPIPQFNQAYAPEPYAGGFNPFQMTFELQFHL